ncbi:MAG: PucR family transcriptional regulator ligand-binding domain-containing protein, partial [Streptosporangiales bacterium]|nr:PucR family transcriptional regulator ligand-binding domain-containing protein [Streptosporangiales bacterium]
MAVDLRALLAVPDLGLTLLTGGRFLDRRVRWVMTTDLADPSRYLSGGELVLTGMMWRHGPDDSAAFVARLVAAGVTALAAGDPDRDEIPGDLVAACRRHGLPLFGVHPDVSFSDVTEYVVRRLSTARSADLAAVLDRHRSLIAAGHDLGGVLELVSGETGMAAWVLSASGRLLAGPAAALPDAVPATAVRRATHAATLPVLVHAEGRTFSVCGAGGPPYLRGLVVVEDDHTRWPRERGDVADELVAVVGIELRQREHDAESAADLVALIDRGSEPGAVRARLRLAGVDGDGPFAVAVGLSPGRAGDGRATLCVELLTPVAAALTWADAGEETVVVARVPAGTPLPDRVRDRAAALAPGLGDRRLAVGLAGPVPSVGDLPAALAEARHAARIA